MNQAKIAKLKAKRAKEQRLIGEQRHRESLETNESLKASIDNLYELINGQEPLDLEKLGKQIESLNQVIDIKDQVKEITEAVKAIRPAVHTDKVDLTPIIKAIEQNKPGTPDFSAIEKAITQIQRRVEEEPAPDSQSPEDYKPFRRVIKLGNRLIYDDQATPSRGGGGGGGSSGGLTNTELRASPVPVSATIDTTGLATTLTDTNTTAIKTAVEILDNAIAGNEMQVDIVTSALPSGASTSAKQDTQQTALDAMKTALEIIDNFISGSRGLVTEDNSAAIKAAVETIDNAISGSEMQVDVITMPTVTVTDTAYATRIDEASDTVTYIGDATIGSAAGASAWRIKKVDTSSGTVITFADGNGNFDNVWNDRAGLSYS